MEKEGYAQQDQITLPSRDKSQTGRGCLQLIIDVPGAEALLLCSELLWGCSINGISRQVLHGRWHRRAGAIIFCCEKHQRAGKAPGCSCKGTFTHVEMGNFLHVL